jgi:hypothetical protein
VPTKRSAYALALGASIAVRITRRPSLLNTSSKALLNFASRSRTRNRRFVGLVTFERTLQSGIEDLGYARRIARLRAYYFDNAPELGPYLLSVEPAARLHVQGLRGGYFQGFRTIAGMVGVITAVLAGSEAGLAVIAAFDVPAASLAAGGVVALAAVAGLMTYQRGVWERAAGEPITVNDVPDA